MENFLELLPYIIAVLIFLIRVFGGDKENEPIDTQPQSVPTTTTEQKSKPTLDDLLKQMRKQILEVERNIQERQAQQTQKESNKKFLDVVKPERGLTNEQRTKDQHFEPYQLKRTSKSPYAKLLSNKNRLKEAFILNEILNRKYF
ncbi:MAG: hypothetical protein RMJ97_02560 [Raineya sp.]|nr:hypothetical protein [Raineya sp.]